MSITAEANGHQPAVPDWLEQARAARERMEGEAQDLQALIDAEQVLIDQIAEVLDDSRDRQARLARALNALVGPQRGRPTKAAVEDREAIERKRWTISDEKIEQTFEAMRTLGREAVVKEIAETSGLREESVRRALRHLRNQERVRLARVEPPKTQVFALMPTGPEATHAA